MKKHLNMKCKFSVLIAASVLVACSPAKFDDLVQEDSRVLPAGNNLEFGAFLNLDGSQQEEIAKQYGYRCDGGGVLPPVLPGPIEPLPLPVNTDPISLPAGENDRLLVSTDDSGISFEEDYWNTRPRYCIPICRVYPLGTGYADPIQNIELSESGQTSSSSEPQTQNFVVSSDNLGQYHRDYYKDDNSLIIGWCEVISEPPVCTNCSTNPRIPLPEPIILPGPTPVELTK